jgi:hypothetical protein
VTVTDLARDSGRRPADGPSGPSLTHSETIFEQFCAALPEGELERLMRCATRLHAALDEASGLENSTVMIAYGGGKDSTYALAFVRGMQLVLERLHGQTFRLRVVTGRHAWMPMAVMENIDRAYRALMLLDDPACELLLIDGEDVFPFRVDVPLPDRMVERGRTDILMTGHRCAGDGRPTFCNACNLNMVRAICAGAFHGESAALIVTGDSPAEQRAYYRWVSRLARRITITPKSPDQHHFGRFMEMFDGVSREYHGSIYGDESPGSAQEVNRGRPGERLSFFSIYEEAHYESSSHWEFLTQFLGFVFDDVAFSFSESDCGNPGLMAHLRGLKAEHRYGTSYVVGLKEYVSFALGLMRKKSFPAPLIDTIRRRYQDEDSVRRMREAMNEYAWQAHRLTEEQLICLVFSPFVDQGAALGEYIAATQADLTDRVDDIRAMLAGGEAGPDDPHLRAALERMSGLSLRQLHVLYQARGLDARRQGADSSLLDAILADDPHKQVIRTRVRADGPMVDEIISGR